MDDLDLLDHLFMLDGEEGEIKMRMMMMVKRMVLMVMGIVMVAVGMEIVVTATVEMVTGVETEVVESEKF